MRSAKSITSLSSQRTSYERRQPDMNLPPSSKSTIGVSKTSGGNPTSPICRCRVMYLGSSVPHITKDGLQGIQEPLRELYPDKATLASGDAGIDSWLSVWSNGILIENVDETGREIKRFFKIDALHYCAAVKYVSLPNNIHQQNMPKFLPLDSPHARIIDSNPPIFASILRRTTGIKVLECHAFICKREAAANALVRCCFHAYADTMYAKQIGADINVLSNEINNNSNQNQNLNDVNSLHGQPPMATKRSKSIAGLNESDINNNNNGSRLEAWRNLDNNGRSNNHLNESSKQRNFMSRRKSVNEHHNSNNCDNDSYMLDKQSIYNEANLKQQKSLSKSMHQLNNIGQLYQQQQLHNNPMNRDQIDHYDPASTSASCINIPNNIKKWQPPLPENQVPLNEQPFYNPYAGRVPCYPPENIIDSGGTLKSIKSLAANSIASTLLRSKKHAKAMSMAQLNHQQQQQQNNNNITSFHQPHLNNSATIGGGLHPMMPPNLFLQNLPLPLINGSQTMKAPSSRSMLPILGPPVNFEPMSPKEMKKLLKKSAKYSSKFCDNGLPMFPDQFQQPLLPHNKSGTMISQGTMFSDIYGAGDVPDMGTFNGILPMIPPPPPPQLNHETASYRLVKPNPEFLKSKAGKKWLKEQKQFKKLLPPHLDVGNLPIIFGPPPNEANLMPPPPLPPNFIQQQQGATLQSINPGLPMLDPAGYYNPHPFYGQNGRASATSTLLRYSPQNHLNGNPNYQQHGHHMDNYNQNELDYRNQNTVMYSNGTPLGQSQSSIPNHRNSRNHHDNGSVIYSNADCNLEPRNLIDNNDSRYYHQQSDRISNQNHMVEQSVISLGDENDYDDEDEDDEQNVGVRCVDNQGDQNNQNYDNNQNWQQTERNNNIVNQNNNNDLNADSQSNYSSGIYKRGNINERAFSYSIRQEQIKSNGNNNILDNEADSYDGNYRNGNHHSHQVNELTAKLENQLNMRSFANQPKIKYNN